MSAKPAKTTKAVSKKSAVARAVASAVSVAVALVSKALSALAGTALEKKAPVAKKCAKVVPFRARGAGARKKK